MTLDQKKVLSFAQNACNEASNAMTSLDSSHNFFFLHIFPKNTINILSNC